MTNFRILFRYEMKKILKRKMVWMAGFIVLAASIMVISSDAMGKYYVDGKVYDTHYHMMITDRAYARALSGRIIDDELLLEMQDAYRKVPADALRYSLTEEYQTYARPYSGIFVLASSIMGKNSLDEMLAWEIDKDDLYEKYVETLETEQAEAGLTEGEKNFWRTKEEQLKTPFVFYYKDAYRELAVSAYILCFMMLFFAAVCLSGIFTKEHTYRTDQLLLSSRLGKKELYFAKAAAGMCFISVAVLIQILTVVILSLIIYGADGYTAALQLLIPRYPYPMQAGEGVIVMYVLLFLAVLVTGVFAMMLSELLQNENAALALISGILFASVFINIPVKYRLLSQLWTYLPSNILNADRVFGLWLVPFFGHFLTAWQAVPVLYLFAGGVFVIIGMRQYLKYQVSGR